jgi:hypothetical protein
MTSTTTTPAQDRYDGYSLGALQICEYETQPFTHPELDVIDRYDEAIAGVPDCFDCESGGSDLIVPDGFTPTETVSMIQSHFTMLTDWRGDIDTLETELRDLGLSTAAHRYVAQQMLSWSQAREGYRAAVINYFVGRDKHGSGFDWPRLPQGYRVVDGLIWLT